MNTGTIKIQIPSWLPCFMDSLCKISANSRMKTRLRWRRDRQIFLRHRDPLIPFVDEHHGDIVPDGIFASTVLADQPGFPVILKQAGFLPHAIRAAQISNNS